jgi:hypothetical protein
MSTEHLGHGLISESPMVKAILAFFKYDPGEYLLDVERPKIEGDDEG